MIFSDRRMAGRLLAECLSDWVDHPNLVVLALPRGGVPVGFEVARALNVPLDVFVVRKLGVPYHEELAMGAIATGGIKIFNDDVLESSGLGQEEIDRVVARETEELERREREYRGNKGALDVHGKVVVLVDDGLATGATMRVAVRALRKAVPSRIIVAVPVAPMSTVSELSREVEAVVCLEEAREFWGVGSFYEDFGQTSDAEVKELLSLQRTSYGGHQNDGPHAFP